MKVLLLKNDGTFRFKELEEGHRTRPYMEVDDLGPVCDPVLTPEPIEFQSRAYFWMTQLRNRAGRVIFDVMEESK